MVRCFIFSLMFCSAFGMENDKIFSENTESQSVNFQIFEPKASEFASIFNFFNEVKVRDPKIQQALKRDFNLHIRSLKILDLIGIILTKIDFTNLPEGPNNELSLQPPERELLIKRPLFKEMTGRILTENDEKILSIIPKKEVVSLVYEKGKTAAEHFNDFRDILTLFMSLQKDLSLKMKLWLFMVGQLDITVDQIERIDTQRGNLKKKTSTGLFPFNRID